MADTFPLAWPAGRPRTPGSRRRAGAFKSHGKPIGVHTAMSRLSDEITRLGGRLPILSTNLERRLDGSPVLNRGSPHDPGVCAYFQQKGEPYALACDTYTEVAQNIAALAAHIESVGAIERYGVASAAETLQAFSALPKPAGTAIALPPAKPWWEVLGIDRAGATRADIDQAWRSKARAAHPDRLGGSQAAMAEVNAARDRALQEVSS